MRRSFLLVTIAALLGGPFTVGASAACYPGPCSGPDARLNGIGMQDKVDQFTQTKFLVAGKNVGDEGSKVRAVTRTNDGKTSPPEELKFVRVDQRFQLYFDWTPDRAGFAHVAACVRALPKDTDRSNDCGVVERNVHQLRFQ